MELTLPTILCCSCGISIEPNAVNMCINCLRDTIDVTQDINTKVTIHSCHNCGRFLGPPWQQLELESKELMVMCLRKINGLNKVKVIDAVWIWTEPHSLRLKIKVTVQKEVMVGAVVQQACVVEFTIRNQQCKHCEASFAQGAWHAIVQLRQRVSHKRTFFYLEQLILKHEAHTECIKIVTFRDGMDFYYKDKNQALRFVDFLTGHVPLRTSYSRKLVSADHTNNTGDFKHNYLVEIAPICKDDLLLLPKDLASKQSNISPLVLVKRVLAGLHVIDPLTGERSEINAEKYWRHSFSPMFSAKALTRFVVLSVEPLLHAQRPSARMKRAHTSTSSKHAMRGVSKLAEVVLAREADLGLNDTQLTVVSHLGPLLNTGDIVLGYDLSRANVNLSENDQLTFDKLSSAPEVVLVRKSYEHKGERKYTLRELDGLLPIEKGTAGGGGGGRGGEGKERTEGEEYDADREDFLQQVDADKEFRAQFNLYKKGAQGGKGGRLGGSNSKKLKREGSGKARAGEREEMDEEAETEGEGEGEGEYDEEEVRLEELLDEMTLSADLLGEKTVLLSSEAEQERGNMFLALGEEEEEGEDEEL